MKKVQFSLGLFLMIFLMIGCSAAAPEPTITPMPPLPATQAPPPLPTPTIKPTENPINFDLSGEWFFLTGTDSIVEPATLTQTSGKLTGTVFLKGGDNISFVGSIDPQTLKISGTWSSVEGKKGIFFYQVREDPNQFSGLYDNVMPLCAARDKSTLPVKCNWETK